MSQAGPTVLQIQGGQAVNVNMNVNFNITTSHATSDSQAADVTSISQSLLSQL